MKHIFFCLPVIGMLIGCTSTQPVKKQNAECYVRYLAPEAQLRAEVTIRESGAGQNALQPITVPGGVRYQNMLMGAAIAPAGMYRVERTGGYTPHHVFAWTGSQNQACTFEIDLAPITAFAFDTDTLSRTAQAGFHWDGAPLQKGESLVFLWENVADGHAVPMEVIGMEGQKSVTFPAAQLGKLSPGMWSLYLVRKKLVETDAAGTLVKGQAEYYTQADTLVVR